MKSSGRDVVDVGASICSDKRVLLLFGAVLLLLLLELSPRFHVVVDKRGSVAAQLQPDQSSSSSIPDELGPLSYSVLHEIVNTTSFDLSRGEVRIWQPHGLASHFFIQVGSYRSSARHFSTVGLISQDLEKLHRRSFECEWVSQGLNSTTTKGKMWKIRPDFGYVRLYGTLVMSCTFDEDVGVGSEGGSLWISASYGDTFRPDEKFIALTEAPGAYNGSAFEPPFPYDYVYCGSPLYGNLSPQRMREWMAYHAHFFGERTHFILYDAGGIHDEVYEVLQPWITQGRVTIQNVRGADIYDGYYHHQFALVNDCMFRAQIMANWTFFFDIDEYLFLNSSSSVKKILEESEQENGATQVQFEPINLESHTCLHDPSVDNSTRDAANANKWIMEKLVFAWNWRWPVMRNRKYAIRSRHCWATGVHKCEHLKEGRTQVFNETDFRFFHYHGTLSVRQEVCTEFATAHREPNFYSRGEDNYTTDETMVRLAAVVKQFEQQAIGHQPFLL